MSAQPLLTLTGLEVSFATARGAVRAVDGVDLTIDRGETVGLVGESGSGKSVLAMTLMGLLPEYAKTSGSVVFDGEDITKASERDLMRLRGRRIGMVFQDPNASLNPVRSVGAQLVETVRLLRGVGTAEARRIAVDLLAVVGLPEPHRQLSAYPHELSGGMRQRVMIALAISGNPDMLIADEATTALDVSVQAQILKLLKGLIAERGMSLLMITHDLGVAAAVSDHIAVMYSGRLAETGDSTEVFDSPMHPYTYALMKCIPSLDAPIGTTLASIEGHAPDPANRPPGCAFADRCPLVHDRCRGERPRMTGPGGESGHRAACWAAEESDKPIADQIGKTEAEAAPTPLEITRPDDAPSGPLLQVRGLKVRYRVRRPMFARGPRDLVAVRGVDLEIAPGQTLGLVGESGSGKSSAARAVLKLEPRTEGSIAFMGRDVSPMSERQVRPLRTHMQMVMQDITTSLSPRFTVREALMEPLQAHHIFPPEGRKKYVESLLRDVALPADFIDRPARELSGGQRQRVTLARALATRPSLIVADEPTSALDVSVRAQMLNLMRAVQAQRGLSYLFISHDLTVIRQMCDRVAVLYLGKVVEEGTREQIFSAPRHPYTRALMDAVPQIGQRELRSISGELPSPLTPPTGCPFRTRCAYARDRCASEPPQLEKDDTGHSVACFFPLSETSTHLEAVTS